ncbi:MAG: gliding motility-associated C-terminal domain-containing protein [Bacteroidia bacterium]|nr:gliding motility-associated C-terminal domain-containing protein [Bacteroidia bacterium]
MPLRYSIAQFKEVTFSIFNKWGESVFTSNNPNACWTGKLNSGVDLSEAVYFFIIKGTSICDQKINLSGTITLLR